jgi:hypothetical protein
MNLGGGRVWHMLAPNAIEQHGIHGELGHNNI